MMACKTYCGHSPAIDMYTLVQRLQLGKSLLYIIK